MEIRFKNTEAYIKSFAETKLIKYFLESYQKARPRTGNINAPVESSGAGGSSLEVRSENNGMELEVRSENNGMDINLYGNAYLKGVDEGTKPFSPNVDAIKNWIRQKPVTLKDFKGNTLPRTESNIASVAYKIGEAISLISLRGIAPANYIGEVVQRAFENIIDGMLPPLKEDVTEKLDDILTSVGYVKKGNAYVLKGE
jgi:hypothetical protein